MHERDIPEILQIERLSFSWPWSAAAFAQEVQKQYAFSRVAVSREKVVGYICVNIIFDDCHILNLAIHPDFRRQAVGTVLMEEALNKSREKGCRFFYLEVRLSNGGARVFYERFGFKVAGMRKQYYSAPIEDAVLMVLRD
jgi:ribosomal-protein-alanine N-acetyltransferase